MFLIFVVYTICIMYTWIQKCDAYIIRRLQKLEVPMARAAIFIVYVWFGFLKLAGMSPAGPLVQALFQKTIGGVSFPLFYVFFSLFEMVIGIVFLIRGLERVALFLLALHLFTTVLPLIFLPALTWQGFLVPTLEGQYIIKNILIAAIAVIIGSRVVPIRP